MELSISVEIKKQKKVSKSVKSRENNPLDFFIVLWYNKYIKINEVFYLWKIKL